MFKEASQRFQVTLCILKPHVVAVPNVLQKIRQTIDDEGFKVVKTKTLAISQQQAAEFYSEHKEKFFYNRLITFMTSGPCIFKILAKKNAIQDWRRLLGPTKVYQTQFTDPESIRGQHGLTDTRNAAHGSVFTKLKGAWLPRSTLSKLEKKDKLADQCVRWSLFYLEIFKVKNELGVELDSEASASREIGVFFPELDTKQCLAEWSKSVTKGQTIIPT